MHTTRGAALLAAAALTVSGLAACGDEGEPTESSSTASPSAVGDDSSSESSSGSTSSSSSESKDTKGDGKVVELPAAAKKHTKAGAIAFNEFYWEQVGKAYLTGNPYVLETYTKGCAVCDNIAGDIRKDKADGIHMSKNPYSVHDSSATPRSDSGFRVQLTVDISKYHQILKDGSKGSVIKAGSMTVVSDTRWTQGGWEIRDQVRTQ